MKVISFVNQKGGVGKTTTCLNMAAALSLSGFKCLLIDVDPQASLSTSAGFEELEEDLTTYEVLQGKDINAAIKTKNGYDVLPTDIRLSGAELTLNGVPGRDFLLKEAIGKLTTPYDYVFIDCAPTLNIITLMALTASNEIIIPVQAQYLALKGVAKLLETVDTVKSRLNPGLEIGGVVVTFYNNRRNLDKDVLSAIEEAFPGKRFNTIITSDTKIAEAPSYGMDIFEYNPKSKGAELYKSLTDDFIKKERISNNGK